MPLMTQVISEKRLKDYGDSIRGTLRSLLVTDRVKSFVLLEIDDERSATSADRRRAPKTNRQVRTACVLAPRSLGVLRVDDSPHYCMRVIARRHQEILGTPTEILA